ncbi:MAG: glycosyltransferase family 4 protein [Spirochaetes bacterium]|nr:glycosyltransferase family 4 protein [Spirochaetota bacterium]
MKIIIVGAQYIGSISGGGGVHVVELTRELGKLGHEVLVLSMGLGDNKKEEEIVLEDPYNPDKKRRKALIKVVRFWTSDSAGIRSPFEGTKQQEIDRLLEFKEKVLEYLVQMNGKDVVHLHGHFVIPAMAKELKERTNYRIVNSIHTFESISEMKKGADGAGEKFIKIMQDMEEQAVIHSDCLICRSREVKEQISRLFPDAVKKTRIAVISSGVSSVFIHHPGSSPQELDQVKKKYNITGELILNINRIDPSKGIENLISAYPRVYDHLRKHEAEDHKLSLVIAGMIEEKNKWYYEKLVRLIEGIKDPQIRQSISIHQNISEKDKLNLFDLARIFVLSSLLEPFGITIVEALAKDIPVVSSGVEGPKDIMELSRIKTPFSEALGGILVNYDDPGRRADNFFEALKYTFDNYSKVKKSVGKGKKKTLKKYAWESLVKEKLRIYKSV